MQDIYNYTSGNSYVSEVYNFPSTSVLWVDYGTVHVMSPDKSFVLLR
jgi:hypothetical protein